MNTPATEFYQRILVIDDNRAIHQDFQKVLCQASTGSAELDEAEAALFGEPAAEEAEPGRFQLDSAFQGRDGLDLVRQARGQKQPYSLAFVDVRMPPGWDGIETTARIWQEDPDLLVVICTAYSDYSWEEIVRKLGHADQLVLLKKPFESDQLLTLAAALTKKWQELQEAKSRSSAE
jgi:DNA-binding NtrC family response regulator